jgi:hypothetical protein
MAAESGKEPVTEAEVTSFAMKLEEWGNQLPEREQALLLIMLSAAEGTAPDDVAGYTLGGVPIRHAASASLSGIIGAGNIRVTAWGEENGPDWINSPPPLHLP